MIVLAAGRVVAAGPPATVLTAELIGEVYGVDATVLRHPRTGRLLLAFSTLQAETDSRSQTEAAL